MSLGIRPSASRRYNGIVEKSDPTDDERVGVVDADDDDDTNVGEDVRYTDSRAGTCGGGGGGGLFQKLSRRRGDALKF